MPTETQAQDTNLGRFLVDASVGVASIFVHVVITEARKNGFEIPVFVEVINYGLIAVATVSTFARAGVGLVFRPSH